MPRSVGGHEVTSLNEGAMRALQPLLDASHARRAAGRAADPAGGSLDASAELVHLCCVMHQRLMHHRRLQQSITQDHSLSEWPPRSAQMKSNQMKSAAADTPAAPDAAAAPSAEHLHAVAQTALAAAPMAAARLLASCGYWPPLLIPAATAASSSYAASSTSPRGVAVAAVPSLRAKLRWIRAAASRGTLFLADPVCTPPSLWSQLLAALADCGDGGICGSGSEDEDEGKGNASLGNGRRGAAHTEALAGLAECSPAGNGKTGAGPDGEVPLWVDGCTLLKLALLPPPTAANVAATLGAQLEPFLRQWMAEGWPCAPLITELRAQMRNAALALCWLLEEQPTLMARAGTMLGPEILLDAVRVVALT